MSLRTNGTNLTNLTPFCCNLALVYPPTNKYSSEFLTILANTRSSNVLGATGFLARKLFPTKFLLGSIVVNSSGYLLSSLLSKSTTRDNILFK